MNYDRVILEILDRVAALEDELEKIKANAHTSPVANTPPINHAPIRKDTTRYLFRNHIYGKNRLVLAVVQAYASEHQNISAHELISAFDKKLQGSLGVVRELNELKETYPDYNRRFFASPDEIISTSTSNCVVCSQWGKFNIDDFINYAKRLGFEIEAC